MKARGNIIKTPQVAADALATKGCSSVVQKAVAAAMKAQLVGASFFAKKPAAVPIHPAKPPAAKRARTEVIVVDSEEEGAPAAGASQGSADECTPAAAASQGSAASDASPFSEFAFTQ